MHSSSTGTDRNAEPTETRDFVLNDYFEQETHFIGDSYTADQLAAVNKRLDRIEARQEHFFTHDRAFPTDGCEFCGVPSAA
jgi:hypothetical protein